MKYLQFCIYTAGIQIKFSYLSTKQNFITEKLEKQTIITKPKVIQILESSKGFQITMINMFKKIEENMNKIYGKIKVTKEWKYNLKRIKWTF